MIFLNAELINSHDYIKTAKFMRNYGGKLRTANSPRNSDIVKLIREFDMERNRKDKEKGKAKQAEMKVKFKKSGSEPVNTSISYYNTSGNNCFTYSYGTYLERLKKSVEVLETKCSSLYTDKAKIYVKFAVDCAKLEVYSEIAKDRVKDDLFNNLLNYQVSNTLKERIRQIKSKFNQGSQINFESLTDLIDSELINYFVGTGNYDNHAIGQFILTLKSRCQLTKLTEFLAIKGDSSNMCLPSDLSLVPTFSNDEDYYKFQWYKKDCKEHEGEYDVNISDEEKTITFFFWTKQDQPKLINKAQNIGHNGEKLSEEFQNATKTVFFNFVNSSGLVTHKYYQILNENAEVKNVFKFRNAYDYNAEFPGLPTEEKAAINRISNVPCRQWIFNTVHIKRACDHYSIKIVQKTASDNYSFFLNFKLKVKDILGSRFNIIKTDGINNYEKSVVGMTLDNTLILNYMYINTGDLDNPGLQPCFQFTNPLPNCVYYRNGVCERCAEGYYESNGLCVQNCPVGTYKYMERYCAGYVYSTCINCNYNGRICEECTSSTICTKCPLGYSLMGNTCVLTCEYNYFPVVIQNYSYCRTCDTRGWCRTCSSATTCIQCNTPYVLHGNTCIERCPDGYYKDEDGICQACSPNCKTCNSTGCTLCNEHYFKYSNVCRPNCPERYYGCAASRSCVNCPSYCKNCVLPDTYNALTTIATTEMLKCTKCISTYSLNTQTSRCVSTCPDGSSSFNGICKTCNPTNCRTCIENVDECTDCLSNFYLREHQCVPDCGNYYYMFNRSCYRCNVPFCISCTNNGNTCQKCEQGKVLYDSRCLDICPDGFANVSGVCERCTNQNCRTCNPQNLDHCIGCYGSLNFLINNDCIQCPNKGYHLKQISSNSYTCTKCCDYCKNCDDNGCGECEQGYFRWNGICVSVCPDGTVNVNGTCTDCTDSNCRKCDALSLGCVGPCLSGYYLKNDRCVNNCGSGYYLDSSNPALLICRPCVANCRECNNGTTCLACKSNWYLFNNLCHSSCQVGYFRNYDHLGNGFCDRCSAYMDNCSECSSSNGCDVCKSGFFMHNGLRCHKPCPNLYYGNPDTMTCDTCVEPCKNCSDRNTCINCIENYNFNQATKKCEIICKEKQWKSVAENKCYDCQDPYCVSCTGKVRKTCNLCENGRYVKNGECVVDCGDGYFQSGGHCYECNSPCKTCSGNADNCLTCYNDRYLWDNQCLTECPTSTCTMASGFSIRAREDTNTCENCEDDCTTCEPNYPDRCDKCKDGRVLHDRHCRFTTCPTGTTDLNGECINCSISNCKQCDYDGQTCRECNDGHLLSLDKKKCLTFCEIGSIARRQSKRCRSCRDDNCNICETSYRECVECKTGFYLSSTQPSCVSSCQEGEYPKLYDDRKNEVKSNFNNIDFYIYYFNIAAISPIRYYKCTSCSDHCKECDVEGNLDPLRNCKRCEGNYALHFSNSKGYHCTEFCPEGYTKKSTDNGYECTRCTDHTNCKVCDASDLNRCLECKYPQTWWFNYRCTSTCDTGYCGVPSTRRCEQCGTGCRTCTSPDVCTRCNDGYDLVNGVCYNKCSSGQVRVGTVCTDCTDKNHCNVCREDNLDYCLRCRNPYLHWNGNCYESCPNGTYYLAGSQAGYDNCANCGSNCRNCQDQYTCNTCKDGYYIFRQQYSNGITVKECISECPAGYYANSNNVCISCCSNCRTCNNPDTCQICEEGTYLYKGLCYYSCPSNTYRQGNNCYDCPTNCRNCDSTGCNMCTVPFYLHNRTCPSSCPEGTVALIDSYVCVNCGENCLSCSASNSGDCLVCKNGYKRQPLIINNLFYGYVCQLECNVGYAHNPVSGVCEPCATNNCNKCQFNSSGIEECTKCSGNTYLAIIEGQKVCVSNCPATYYGNNNTGKCENCCSGCNTCNDPDQCIYCQPNKVLYNHLCRDNCPSGYYKTNIPGTLYYTCSPCDPNCKTCEDYNNFCTSCNGNDVLQNNTCVETCDPGYVKVGNVCERCTDYQNCLKCDSNDRGICRKCIPSMILSPQNTCGGSCPAKYYTEIRNNHRYCTSCSDPYCNTCDQNVCYDCVSPKLLCNGVCKDRCDSGYITLDNRTCVRCETGDPYCKRCKRNDLSRCDICQEGYKYCHITNRCVEQCCDHTYQTTISTNPARIECFACSTGCDTCNAADNCTKCLPGFWLKNGYCVTSCGNGYVKGVDNNGWNICKSCTDQNCLKCDPKDCGICVDCAPGYYIQNGVCKVRCDDGYYVSNVNHCLPCNVSNCSRCKNANECLPDGCTLPYFHFDGTCYLNCPAGYRRKGDTCEACSVTHCTRCHDGANTCDECKDTRFVYFNKVSNSYQCLDTCPATTYISENYCKDCISPCRTCNSDHSCITCIPNYFLYYSSCISDCKIGTVAVGNECKDCTQKEQCKICDPNDFGKCLECRTGYYRYKGICYKDNCPQSTCRLYPNQINSDECTDCSEYCYECDTKTNCKKCQTGYYLFMQNGGYKCLQTCPVGYIANPTSGYCQLCDTNNLCLDCSWENSANVVSGVSSITTNSNQSTGRAVISENDQRQKKMSLSEVEKQLDKRTSFMEVETLLQEEMERTKSLIPKSYRFNKMIDFYFRKNNYLYRTQGNDDIICERCTSGYYLENNICVPQCSEGYYLYPIQNPKFCRSCGIPNCNNCILKSDGSKECIDCKTPYKIQKGQCVEDCDLNTCIIDNECKDCLNPKCKKCYPNFNDCVTCLTPYFYYDRKCYDSCPDGYTHYVDGDQKICVQCTGGCLTCEVLYQNGTVSFVAEKCTCPPLHENKNGVCVLITCPQGTVLTNIGCVPCDDSNCATCDADDNTICINCLAPYKKYGNTCVNPCPSGTRTSGNICIDCIGNCRSCSSEGTCDLCETGFYYCADTNSCTRCNTPNKVIVENKFCRNCSTGCKSCVTGYVDRCKDCPTGLFLQGYECVTRCRDGTYGHNGVCKDCLPQCLTCSNDYSCITCKDGFALHNGNCLGSCPSGYYKVMENNQAKCVACTQNCNSCNSTGCIGCIQGYWPFNGLCVNSCQDGYAKMATNGSFTCTKCSDLWGPTCKKCTSNGCTDCENEQLISHDGRCTNICDIGYYKESNICKPCGIYECTECDNPNTCKRCNVGFYLHNGECVPNCPDRFCKVDTPIRKCKPCDSYCRICDATNGCQICEDGYYLTSDKKCVSPCPPGYTGVNGNCVRCTNQNCSICELERPALCIGGCNYQLGFYLYNNDCVNPCPLGTFSNNNNGTCDDCEPSCKKCTSLSQCIECKAGFRLNSSTGECEPLCPKKQALINGKCVCCPDEHCNYCDNLVGCVECSEGRALHHGKCYTKCPAGYYSKYFSLTDSSNGRSSPLTSQTNVDSLNFKRFFKSKSEIQNLKSKQKTLSKAKQRTSALSRVRSNRILRCVKCSENCLNCNDNNSCIQCAKGYYKNSQGKCVRNCGSGYYADCDAGKCSPCISGCAICTTNKNYCDVCQTNKIMKYVSTTEGYYGLCYDKTVVQEGYYIDQELSCYMPCRVSRCISCGSSDKVCTLCEAGYTISNDRSTCYKPKNILKVFPDTRIFVNNSNINYTYLSEIGGFSDLVASCSKFSIFGVLTHIRVITNPSFTNEPLTIMEYRPSGSNSFNSERNKISFRISIDSNSCFKFFVSTNNKLFSTQQADCSFGKLSQWNIITANINLDLSEISCKLKVFNIANQTLNEYKFGIPSSEYDKDKIEILSPQCGFGINPGSDFDVFELAHLSLIEFNPELSDFKDTFARESVLCDDNQCSSCAGNPSVCTSCYSYREGANPSTILRTSSSNELTSLARKNNLSIYVERETYNSAISPYQNGTDLAGKCSFSFVPLTSLQYATSNTKLRNLMNSSGRISTNIFSFSGFIFTKANIKQESSASPITVLEGGYYSSNYSQVAIKVLIKNGILNITAGDNIYELENLDLKDSTWYYVAVSVNSNTKKIAFYIYNNENGETHNNEITLNKKEGELRQNTLRCTDVLEFKPISNKINIYDFRIYVNSYIEEDTITSIIRLFDYPINCKVADGNLNCLQCKEGYEHIAGSNDCSIKEFPTESFQRIGKIYNAFDGNPEEVCLFDGCDTFNRKLKDNSSFSLLVYLRRTSFGYNKISSPVEPLVSFTTENGELIPIVGISTDDSSQNKFENYTLNLDLSRVAGGDKKLIVTLPYSSESFDYGVVLLIVKIASSETTFTIAYYDFARNLKSQILTASTTNTNLTSQLTLLGSVSKLIPIEVGPLFINVSQNSPDPNQINLIRKISTPNPGCTKFDYQRNLCLTCARGTGENTNSCRQISVGSNFYSLLTLDNLNNAKQGSTNLSYSLSNVFSHGVHSNTYSVTGWFNFVDYVKNSDSQVCKKNCKALLFRLTNFDKVPVARPTQDTGYNHDLNLIGINLKTDEDETKVYPEIVISSYPVSKSFEIKIQDININRKNWIYFYVSVDLNTKKVNCAFYNRGNNSSTTIIGSVKTFDLASDGKYNRLESFSEINFFNIVSVKESLYKEKVLAAVYNVDIVVNKAITGNSPPQDVPGTNLDDIIKEIECNIDDCKKCSSKNNRSCEECNDNFDKIKIGQDHDREDVYSCVPKDPKFTIIQSDVDVNNNNLLPQADFQKGYSTTNYNITPGLDFSNPFTFAFYFRRNYISPDGINEMVTNLPPFFINGSLKVKFFNNYNNSRFSLTANDQESQYDIDFNSKEYRYKWIYFQILVNPTTKKIKFGIFSTKANAIGEPIELTYNSNNTFFSPNNLSIFTYNGQINVENAVFYAGDFFGKISRVNPAPHLENNIYRKSEHVCEGKSIYDESNSRNAADRYGFLCFARELNFYSLKNIYCNADNLSGTNLLNAYRTNMILFSDYIPANQKIIRFNELFLSFQTFIPKERNRASLFRVFSTYQKSLLSANAEDIENSSSSLINVYYEDGVVYLAVRLPASNIYNTTIVKSGRFRSNDIDTMHFFGLSISKDRIILKIKNDSGKESNFNKETSLSIHFDEENQLGYFTGAGVIAFGKFINGQNAFTTPNINMLPSFENISLDLGTNLDEQEVSNSIEALKGRYSCGSRNGECKYCFNDQKLVGNQCFDKSNVDVSLSISKYPLGLTVNTQNNLNFETLSFNGKTFDKITFFYRRSNSVKEDGKVYGVINIGGIKIYEFDKGFVVFFKNGEVVDRAYPDYVARNVSQRLSGKKNVAIFANTETTNILYDYTGYLNYGKFFSFTITNGSKISITVKSNEESSTATFKGSLDENSLIDIIREDKLEVDGVSLFTSNVDGGEFYKLKVFSGNSNAQTREVNTQDNNKFYPPLLDPVYMCNKSCASPCISSYCPIKSKLFNSDTDNDILGNINSISNDYSKFILMKSVFKKIVSNNPIVNLENTAEYGLPYETSTENIDKNLIDINSWTFGIVARVSSNQLQSSNEHLVFGLTNSFVKDKIDSDAFTGEGTFYFKISIENKKLVFNGRDFGRKEVYTELEDGDVIQIYTSLRNKQVWSSNIYINDFMYRYNYNMYLYQNINAFTALKRSSIVQKLMFLPYVPTTNSTIFKNLKTIVYTDTTPGNPSANQILIKQRVCLKKIGINSNKGICSDNIISPNDQYVSCSGKQYKAPYFTCAYGSSRIGEKCYKQEGSISSSTVESYTVTRNTFTFGGGGVFRKNENIPKRKKLEKTKEKRKDNTAKFNISKN